MYTPFFAHNCACCTFLGDYQTESGRHDLYYCAAGNLGIPTIVARYGSSPDQYASGLGNTRLPALVEGASRARAAGLVE
jgi:hypothetical protein